MLSALTGYVVTERGKGRRAGERKERETPKSIITVTMTIEVLLTTIIMIIAVGRGVEQDLVKGRCGKI